MADGISCNQDNGQCNCKPGIIGLQCDNCDAGFFNFPECQGTDNEENFLCPNASWPWLKINEICFHNFFADCDCIQANSIGGTCNSDNGQCMCKTGYSSRRCDGCSEGYHGYPNCEGNS